MSARFAEIEEVDPGRENLSPTGHRWSVWDHVPRVQAITWVREYGHTSMGTKAKLLSDLSAGVVVAVMLIPQGMAYAILAGMPAISGLYASIVALLVYPFFSTAPQLAVGPVAVVAMMSYSACAELAAPDTPRFYAIAMALAFESGVFQVLLGMLKAGFLVNFLSHPLLSGFTCAAAIIIGASQLGAVLGIKGSRSNYVYEVIGDAILNIKKANWVTILLAVENLFLLYALQYLRQFLLKRPLIKRRPGLVMSIKAMPAALLVVIVNICLNLIFSLDTQHKVSIIGNIPSGLPSPVNIFASVSGSDLLALVPSACIVSLLGFMESISIAKAMSLKYRDNPKLVPNQELAGLGLANIAVAFFQGFPVTGGFSRTGVNADAGAKSPASSWISAVLLLITVAVLTPLFKRLPSVTLGCIIIFAVIKLIDFGPAKELWKLSKRDFLVFCISFLATLGLGIEAGIGVACGVSIALILQQSTMPYWAVLGRLGSSQMYRNVRRFPQAIQDSRHVIVRFDAQLYFANSIAFEELIVALATREPAPEMVIADCGVMSSIDSTGCHTVLSLADQLHDRGVRLILCNARGPVRTTLKRAASLHHGADHLCLDFLSHSVHSAVTGACSDDAQSVADEPHGDLAAVVVDPETGDAAAAVDEHVNETARDEAVEDHMPEASAEQQPASHNDEELHPLELEGPSAKYP